MIYVRTISFFGFQFRLWFCNYPSYILNKNYTSDHDNDIIQSWWSARVQNFSCDLIRSKKIFSLNVSIWVLRALLPPPPFYINHYQIAPTSRLFFFIWIKSKVLYSELIDWSMNNQCQLISSAHLHSLEVGITIILGIGRRVRLTTPPPPLQAVVQLCQTLLQFSTLICIAFQNYGTGCIFEQAFFLK